ncbi:MAG: hypothetical protein KAR19_06880 [Bacteroidales bacterium]|nr:hypothetical protein [Bacteroidales bacterium]
MKRFIQKAGLLLCTIQFGMLVPVSGQLLTMDFIYGGIDDAEEILQEYLRPYASIIGSDLNAGWYNTARPHKLGGLDITATVSWAKAPASALSYDMSQLELNGDVDQSNTSLAPTIAGKQEVRPRISYSESVDLGGGDVQDVEYASYTMPDGTGVDFFPLPMGQLTVGLPFGTDVSARFVPMMRIGDYGEIGLWGVGGKHSISQWLPFINKVKIIDISLQGGYTKVTSSAHVVVEPQPGVEVDPSPDFNWDDQFVVQMVEGWTVNLIASQTLPVITFYQGIGYASSVVEVLVEGHFPIHSVITEGDDLGKTTYEVVKDPIAMEYRNFNNLRLNVGARIKLGVFTIHYDFTHTLYATHSVGVGVSFR